MREPCPHPLALQHLVDSPGGEPSRQVVITAANAVPCDGRPPIRDALVLLRGNRIAAVGGRSSLERSVAREATEWWDFGDAVILPGLVNAHTHLEFTAAGPLSNGRDFATWIGDVVAWSRAASPDQRLASARVGAGQMLRAGITCVGDIASRGQGLQAMLESCLHGISYCEFVGGYADDGSGRIADLVERADAAAALVAGADAGVWVGLSPHAPYTVSMDAARRVTATARAHRWRLGCHLAESAAEVEFLASGGGPLAPFMGAVLELDGPLRPAETGHTPLTYAESVGLLQAGKSEHRPLIVHAAQLGEADVDLLAAAHVAVALCPRSNELLCVGAAAPVSRLAGAGIPVAVCTDSAASNSGIDLFSELRALYALWRRQEPLLEEDRAARRLLGMITVEAAQALDLADELGTLTPGKRADIAVVDRPAAGLDGSRLVTAIVSDLDAGAVIATFTDGRRRHGREGLS